ncbi:hypothetical protein [uncultured Tateyamaria sp.]|uniref:hypothetical protein n=1 Tax=uncultured Tateyamaria sp. TaxID=455651 RepID=UPI0026253E9F|nr:hypothetical protein [uncultured Tateyamaria sp.]
MSIQFWDELESCLGELTFEQGIAVRRAVPIVCDRFAGVPVEYLVLSLASAASTLEDSWPIADRLNQRHLLDLYRAAAAVSADIALHSITGTECRQCRHLLSHWRGETNGYFDTHHLRAS